MERTNVRAARRRAWLIAGCLAAGGAAVLVAARTTRGPGAEPALWANARACLVGEPLRDDERLTSRLRAIELGFGGRRGACLARRDASLAKQDCACRNAPDAWPCRCADHLAALRDERGALAAAASQVDLDAPATLEPLFARASALPAAEPGALVEKPPAVRVPSLPAAVLAATTLGDSSYVETRAQPGGELRLLTRRTLCAADPKASALRCRELCLDTDMGGARLADSATGKPATSGRDAEARLVAEDGTVLLPLTTGPYNYGLHVGAAGIATVFASTGIDETVTVSRVRDGRALARELPEKEAFVGIAGDFLLTRGASLLAWPIVEGEELLGTPFSVATTVEKLAACPGGRFAALMSSSAHPVTIRVHALERAAWPVVETVTIPDDVTVSEPAWSCRPDRLVVTWLESARGSETHRAQRLACAADGCRLQSRDVAVLGMVTYHFNGEDMSRALTLVPVGDDALLVAESVARTIEVVAGIFGAGATQRVVLDLESPDAPPGWRLGSVWPADGWALLELRTTIPDPVDDHRSKHRGLFFRLEADGTAVPLPLEPSGPGCAK
ncbi:MAG: hypothetical protein HY908_34940 [Myxococcales bacterium]|nr:hypothetical protein [Myxococcales bacterium]